MWMLLAGLVLGAVAGLYFPLTIPPAVAPFLAATVLVSLDSVVGGAKAGREGNFIAIEFVEGWVANLVIALALTFFGERLGVQLYFAVCIVLSMRIFHNFSGLRRTYLRKKV